MELELANVTQLLDGTEKKSKRYIPLPVSSSLPDHISSDFVLGRFNASSSVAAQKVDKKKANESETRADEKKQTDEERKDSNSNEKTDDNHEKTDSHETNEGTPEKELAIVREVTKNKTNSSKQHKAFGVHTTHLTDNQPPPTDDEDLPQNRRASFEPTVILCFRLNNNQQIYSKITLKKNVSV